MAHIERHFGYLGDAGPSAPAAPIVVLGARPETQPWLGEWDRLAEMVERDVAFGCGPAELAKLSSQADVVTLSRRTAEAIKVADQRYPDWHLLAHALAHVDDVTITRFHSA